MPGSAARAASEAQSRSIESRGLAGRRKNQEAVPYKPRMSGQERWSPVQHRP